MSLTLNSLRLLQNLLASQKVSLTVPDEEIEAVLVARRELAAAIAEAEAMEPISAPTPKVN